MSAGTTLLRDLCVRSCDWKDCLETLREDIFQPALRKKGWTASPQFELSGYRMT